MDSILALLNKDALLARVKKAGVFVMLLYGCGLIQVGSALNPFAEEMAYEDCEDSSFVRKTGQLCPRKPLGFGTRITWMVVGLVFFGAGRFVEKKRGEAGLKAAVLATPFPWEASVAGPPAIPELGPVSAVGELTQSHVDGYVATNHEFWGSFHRSLQAPYSGYASHNGKSLREFAQVCNNAPDVKQALEALNQYPVLKGEYLVSSAGPHLVTNYRLQMFIDNIRHNIPLADLVKYDMSGGPLQMVWMHEGQEKSLSITGTVLLATVVDGARSAKAYETLGDNQKLLLGRSRFDLGQVAASLQFQDIALLDPSEGTAV